jgi:xanthine dehydrogenase accessory factor
MHLTENMLEMAMDWMAAGREIAFATVIRAQGSSPRPVGSQLLIDEDGNFEGSVSGGCIEGAVVSEGMEAIALGKPRRLFFGVTSERDWEVGLACGGEVEIFVEPLSAHGELLAAQALLRDTRQPTCMVTDLASGEKFFIPTLPKSV